MMLERSKPRAGWRVDASFERHRWPLRSMLAADVNSEMIRLPVVAAWRRLPGIDDRTIKPVTRHKI